MNNILKISIILLSISFIGCNKKNEKNYFKVGIMVPLSGEVAEYGVAVKNAYELARKLNPKGFKHIKFIYEDNRYEGKTAVSAFLKLANQDKVHLIYNWGTSPNEATTTLAKRLTTPSIVETIDDDITKDCRMCIKTPVSGKDYNQPVNDYLEANNFKKIGIIKNELGFFNNLIKHITAEIVFKESVPLDTSDFNSIISKIQNKEVDALGVFLVSSQVPLFYSKAKIFGYTPKTFSTDFLDSQSVVDKSGELLNGVVFSALDVSKEFRKNYTKEYKNDIQIAFAGSAYDKAKIFSTLFNFKDSSKLTSEQIIDKFKSLKPFQGANGLVEYEENESGKIIKAPAILKGIRDKKLVVIR